jgi:hypothetical protein
MATPTQVGGPTGTGLRIPRRPGWVTFAAVVTFVVGIVYGLIALTEFANSYWFYDNSITHVYDLASSHLLWWGIFDSILCAITIAAGISILRGGFFGFTLGLMGAGFSFLRWLFYIPATPWLAISILVINALVIYGLTASADYFEEASSQYTS